LLCRRKEAGTPEGHPESSGQKTVRSSVIQAKALAREKTKILMILTWKPQNPKGLHSKKLSKMRGNDCPNNPKRFQATSFKEKSHVRSHKTGLTPGEAVEILNKIF